MQPLVISVILTGLALAAGSLTEPTAADADRSSQADRPVQSETGCVELPVVMTVKQRSTTSIPRMPSEVSLTVDDVTGNQVMVTLIGKSKAPLLGPLSMKQGDSVRFQLGGSGYALKLTELNNALIGDDFASFSLDKSNSNSLTESQKIDHLIQAVEMTDAVFVRNGIGYRGKDAAEHLRRKRDATKEDVRTASEFIERVASKSSLTGEQYKVRLSDSRTISAAAFLHDELVKLERSREGSRETEPDAERQ